MVEPELTEVGELHSLTDWQVSEASEEAELDEFCWVFETKQNKTKQKRAPRHSKEKKEKTSQQRGGSQPTGDVRHTNIQEKEERSKVLGLKGEKKILLLNTAQKLSNADQ